VISVVTVIPSAAQMENKTTLDRLFKGWYRDGALTVNLISPPPLRVVIGAPRGI
jgi:hypothetical protein